MEAPPACDIREIRPDEAAAALGLLGGGLAAETLERRLSVGAFDPADGTLRGVALNETLTPRGCAVHLHCEDPVLGRALLDRALSKAAAAGHRASRVALHPEPTARELWDGSSWPARAPVPAGVESAADSVAMPPADEPAVAAAA